MAQSKGLSNVFKLRDIYNVKDPAFGAKGDGVTDDLAAITAAYNAVPAGAGLYFPATSTGYLISAKLTIAKNIRLIFEGKRAVTSTDLPGSYLLKKSTVATSAVDITANGVEWEGGGVLGQNGNAGDGIVVLANNVTLHQVAALNCGNDGIRIGADAAGNNSNAFLLVKPVCGNNGRHGIYLNDDNTLAAVDANAGTIILPFCQNNSVDGIRIANAWFNTIIGPLTEGNVGCGIRVAAGAKNNVIVGGDSEVNTAQDLQIDATANFTMVLGLTPSAIGKITDNGTGTIMLGQYYNKLPAGGLTSVGLGLVDTTTGWYRPAADQLALAIAGAQKWLATATGVGPVASRMRGTHGANVATANNLTLGTDGNLFQLSGTVQINLLDNTNWQDGTIVYLLFAGGATTVKNNQAAAGAFRPILMSTGADFVSNAAGLSILGLVYDSSVSLWREVSRTS